MQAAGALAKYEFLGRGRVVIEAVLRVAAMASEEGVLKRPRSKEQRAQRVRRAVHEVRLQCGDVPHDGIP